MRATTEHSLTHERADAGTPLPRGGRIRIAMAVAASVGAHLLLFGLLLSHLLDAPRGGGGQVLDAIEIDVVDAVALESAKPSAALDGGGQAAPADAVAAVATSDPAPATAAPMPSTPPPSAAVDLPSPPERDATDVTGSTLRPTEREPATIETPQVTVEPATPTTLARPTPPPSPAIGSVATSPSAIIAAAAAAASPGDIARFNAEVRKALGRHRPKRGWPSGHLLLAFSVADDGRVESAELLEASGNARLDRLTLEWIGGVSMPTPPPGLSRTARRYSIPVTIR